MQLKKITSVRDGKVRVSLSDFSESECRRILIERNSYMLEVTHSWGEDYGGSQYSENCETYYEEILPERILVKNGHFAGVSICTEYYYFNGGGKTFYKNAIILVDSSIKYERDTVRDGSCYSDDDHSRWNYFDYSLVTYDEAKLDK